MRLEGEHIYLDTLSREDCRKLYEEYEFDLSCPAEFPAVGIAAEQSLLWYDEIQKLQGKQNIRLGIFLKNGNVIGDVALQDIDRANGCCSVGIGIAKIANRSKGYGREAIRLIVDYGFRYLPLHRITADTADINVPCQHALERCGFEQEGRERKAVFLDGAWHDRMKYSILREEWKS